MAKRERLIQLRKRKNLTRKDVADKVGISTSFYGKIERNERNPIMETADKIKDAVGASTVDEILFNRECGESEQLPHTGTEG